VVCAFGRADEVRAELESEIPKEVLGKVFIAENVGKTVLGHFSFRDF